MVKTPGAYKKIFVLSLPVAVGILSLLLVLPYITNKKNSVSVQSQAQEAPVELTTVAQEASSASFPTVTATPQPTAAPVAQHSIKFGVIVNDYANRTGELESVKKQLNNRVSSVTIYKQFGNGNKSLILQDLSYIKSQQMELIVTWEPWNPDEGMTQTTDYLTEIIAGSQDSYIKEFANSVKSYNAPVVIRFAHEMNGNWYPWGNRAEEYKAAYRHLYEVFRQEGVSNVVWEWSVNADNVPYRAPSDVARFYPGNDVVDRISIDGYNFGEPWRSFDQVFKPMYSFLAKNYHQPILIGETASGEVGGDKALWITQALSSAKGGQYPRLTGFTWFHLIKERDWRIDSSQASLQAAQSQLK